MVAQRNRDYELVMVLNPEATEEEIAAKVDSVAGFITEHGGSIAEQANWGVRRLAYPIKRFHEGNYLLTQFTLDAKFAQELERTLIFSEDVLRHLITKVKASAE